MTGNESARAKALHRCSAKFAKAWSRLEARATRKGGDCPSVADEAAIEHAIDLYTTNLARALDGEVLATAPLPKTGQSTCYDADGAVISCAGTGQDGEFQTGLADDYVDNGDGTISDMRTGLMWEKLSADGSIHDRANSFYWDGAFDKIKMLNQDSFAGHRDWRVPNITELESILKRDADQPPFVAPAFNSACVASCTVRTCSCTQSGTGLYLYYSSTTFRPKSTEVYGVLFDFGLTAVAGKGPLPDHPKIYVSPGFVRAVRGLTFPRRPLTP